MNQHDHVVAELRKLLALQEEEFDLDVELKELRSRILGMRNSLHPKIGVGEAVLVDGWVCWFEGVGQLRKVKVANLDSSDLANKEAN